MWPHHTTRNYIDWAIHASQVSVRHECGIWRLHSQICELLVNWSGLVCLLMLTSTRLRFVEANLKVNCSTTVSQFCLFLTNAYVHWNYRKTRGHRVTQLSGA